MHDSILHNFCQGKFLHWKSFSPLSLPLPHSLFFMPASTAKYTVGKGRKRVFPLLSVPPKRNQRKNVKKGLHFHFSCVIIRCVDRVWRSLVSRLNGVQEAAGSSPVTRTRLLQDICLRQPFFIHPLSVPLKLVTSILSAPALCETDRQDERYIEFPDAKRYGVHRARRPGFSFFPRSAA